MFSTAIGVIFQIQYDTDIDANQMFDFDFDCIAWHSIALCTYINNVEIKFKWVPIDMCDTQLVFL